MQNTYVRLIHDVELDDHTEIIRNDVGQVLRADPEEGLVVEFEDPPFPVTLELEHLDNLSDTFVGLFNNEEFKSIYDFYVCTRQVVLMRRDQKYKDLLQRLEHSLAEYLLKVCDLSIFTLHLRNVRPVSLEEVAD